MISKVLISRFGQIAVFDEKGDQIPDLQRSLVSLWTSHAQKMGFEVDGLRLEFMSISGSRFVKVFKTEDGYNWEMA